MDKIIDRLYLGNLKGASDYNALKAAGITHILSVAQQVKPFFPKDFKYKVISVSDTSQSSLIRHFPAAISFIKEAMSKGGVLVHCYAGVSRSASCVIAYLMQEKDMKFQEAFQFASKRRPVIFPNMGFQRQLCEFEKLLHLKKSYSSPNRVDKTTQKLIQGTLGNHSNKISKQADENVLKQFTQSLIHGPAANNNIGIFNSAHQTVANQFFDRAVPANEDYLRATFLDKTNGFGAFSADDKLGRLAEINKTQLDNALRDMNSFARTDAGFNRVLQQKHNVSHKQNRLNPIISQARDTLRHQSPQKMRTDKVAGFGSALKLDKQPLSSDMKMQGDKNNNKIEKTRQSGQGSSVGYTNVNQIYQDYKAKGIQKQGSAASLRNQESGRPKTNQSQRGRVFGQSQPSFDQNAQVRINSDNKNYLNSFDKRQMKIAVNGPTTNNQNSLSKFRVNVPESPNVVRNKNNNLLSGDSLFGNSAYQVLGQKQGNQARLLYVCIGCNTPLFTSKDITEHTASLTTASSSGRAIQSNKICSSFYVKQREWMPNFGQAFTEQTKGTLECYRKVCKRKLGQYSTQGLRCNCGKMVKPAYQIAKNKVKLVGVTQTNGVNLGSSGNSTTNLNSVSDMTKYPNLPSPQPYGSTPVPPNQLMRDIQNPKSQEYRQNGLNTNDGKKRHSGASLQFQPTKYEKSQGILKKGLIGLTEKNMNTQAYTRAEKLLSYQQIEFDQSLGGNLGSHNVTRDPYQGFTQAFQMPPIINGNNSDNDYASTSAGFNQRASQPDNTQISDILKDRNTQSRVVDNVMNFFRFKEAEKTTQHNFRNNNQPNIYHNPQPKTKIQQHKSADVTMIQANKTQKASVKGKKMSTDFQSINVKDPSKQSQQHQMYAPIKLPATLNGSKRGSNSNNISNLNTKAGGNKETPRVRNMKVELNVKGSGSTLGERLTVNLAITKHKKGKSKGGSSSNQLSSSAKVQKMQIQEFAAKQKHDHNILINQEGETSNNVVAH